MSATAEIDVIGKVWRFAILPYETIMAATKCSGVSSVLTWVPRVQPSRPGTSTMGNSNLSSSYCFSRVTPIVPGSGEAKFDWAGLDRQIFQYIALLFWVLGKGFSDINLVWSYRYFIWYYFISFYVISFYFTDLVVLQPISLPALCSHSWSQLQSQGGSLSPGVWQKGQHMSWSWGSWQKPFLSV